MNRSLMTMVDQGQIKTFPEFARACGALMLQGHDLKDLEVQSEYHLGRSRVDTADLEAVEKLDEAGMAERSAELYDMWVKNYEVEQSIFDSKIKKFSELLEQAKKFEPPTDDFEPFKKFMVDTLESCVTLLNKQKEKLPKPKRLHGEEWRQHRITMLKEAIAEHLRIGMEMNDQIRKMKLWHETLEEALI